MKATTKRKAVDKAGPATGPAAPAMAGPTATIPASPGPVRNVLADRAMLVTVAVRVWSARKLDKRVTAETNAANNASPDAGRFNKALLSKEALAETKTIEGQARTELYLETLPWCNEGSRIMSGANYSKFAEKFRKLRNEFNASVDKFCEGYADFIEKARADLGDMFNPADYPPIGHIRSKFDFSVTIFPVPDVADFRVDMSEGQVAEIRETIETQLRDAMSIAQREVWQRMLAKVAHMAKKLRAYSPAEFDPKSGEITKKASDTFRDSLVENVREIADLMPVLNITGSAELDAMAQRLIAELCDTSPEDLRLDEMVRSQTAEKAENILAEIETFLA